MNKKTICSLVAGGLLLSASVSAYEDKFKVFRNYKNYKYACIDIKKDGLRYHAHLYDIDGDKIYDIAELYKYYTANSVYPKPREYAIDVDRDGVFEPDEFFKPDEFKKRD